MNFDGENYDKSAQICQDFFANWCPQPSDKNFRTQFGVHLEEIAETLQHIEGVNGADTMVIGFLKQGLQQAADHFKKTEGKLVITDRIEFLDGLCDSMVTAIGTGYMAGMNVADAFAEVNRSNNSKFDENGKPILDNNLKLKKGPFYTKPDLKTFI